MIVTLMTVYRPISIFGEMAFAKARPHKCGGLFKLLSVFGVFTPTKQFYIGTKSVESLIQRTEMMESMKL